MRTGTITLVIDSSLEHVFLVGLAVNQFCSLLPLTEVEVYETELCVVEAVNNAIEHAYVNAAGHAVAVDVTLAADQVVFKIRDGGRSMDPEIWRRPLAEPTETEMESEGGRGFLIMRTCMDELHYDRAGDTNVLTLVKYLKTAEPLSA